jgi:cation diffusion facilitator CzcD-associated flavoprotein CzcO
MGAEMAEMSATTIDHEALRAKYRAERDKRLRPDGAQQYIEPAGRYAHFLEDPYVKRVPRTPLADDVEVAIIGAGFAGLAVGARLKEAGITNVRLVDGAGDVGGTWYWNRYPGAMCDTAAMIYMPLLEETGHMPTQKYTGAAEIFGHAQRIAKQFGLYENALFSTSVTGISWDESAERWIIRTDRGDAFRARYVTMGLGPLSKAKLPGIPGIESFKGHAFHTSRWDYEYTGGDPSGAPLAKLADKRVGIIGTGATAVQCIPHLARSARELYVFQRTPSSIDIRNNHAIDPDWFKTLEPGWQHKWLINFATLQTGGFAPEDLVKDGWTDISQRIRDHVVKKMGQPGVTIDAALMMSAYEDCDDAKMEEIRARVDSVVGDEATAQALKPWYRQLCKRPCFHDEYLDSYNQPGTKLVDTSGKGVERIDETGVWVAGKHYELDCLIFASGFEFGTTYTRRAGFDPEGRGGVKLSEHWGDGMRTMHGIHTHGFPNLFVMGFTQAANLISNVTSNLVDSGTTIAKVIAHARSLGATQVEVTADAEKAWVAKLESGTGPMLGNADCTPGYYNNEGGEMGRRERMGFIGYPEGPVAYFAYIDGWRKSGKFEGLEFRKA